MQLEDGRFLMSSQRYDSLLKVELALPIWFAIEGCTNIRHWNTSNHGKDTDSRFLYATEESIQVPGVYIQYCVIATSFMSQRQNQKDLKSSGVWCLQEHTKEELDSWKIVRVSEDFRVIALGLPVPRYTGNPLDPPLRSRFQARDIYYLPFKVGWVHCCEV